MLTRGRPSGEESSETSNRSRLLLRDNGETLLRGPLSFPESGRMWNRSRPPFRGNHATTPNLSACMHIANRHRSVPSLTPHQRLC